MVSTPGFHPGGLGSTPGMGRADSFIAFVFNFTSCIQTKRGGPGNELE